MEVRVKPYFYLFFIGAILGTFLDGLQTYGGVAYYTSPFVLKTAWWVPFLFGTATVAVAYSHCKLHPLFLANSAPFWGSLGFLLVMCMMTAFWHTGNAQKTSLLFNFYLISWGLFDRTPKSFFLAIGTALGGTAVEITLSFFDLYKYSQPDFLGVPYWLPAMYCHLSQTTGHLGRLLLASNET